MAVLTFEKSVSISAIEVDLQPASRLTRIAGYRATRLIFIRKKEYTHCSATPLPASEDDTGVIGRPFPGRGAELKQWSA